MILVAILFVINVHADSGEFRVLYDQGRFSESIEIFKKEGLRTYADYYNLANCYFKIGKPQIAYAYYQKAFSLSKASNDDVRFNLLFTEALLEKNGLLTRDLSLWRGKIIPNARKIGNTIPMVIVLIANITLGMLLLKLKKGWGGNLIPVFAVWLFITLSCLTVGVANSVKLSAVIATSNARASDSSVDSSVAARSGPSDDFTELFRLSAGTLVERLGENRNNWVKIRFSLGNVGWIMEKDLIEL